MPVESKMAESHAREWMMKFIEKLIDPHQFGSLQGSSTVHALVELTHMWTQGVETRGKVIHILLLDFWITFDHVDHHTLLSKLANTGIPNFLIQWITAFLCEHRQRVKIDYVRSEWLNINAGVPKGTLLGPFCFVLHINDLHSECLTVKYVDDSTVWEQCEYTCEDSHCNLQQSKLTHGQQITRCSWTLTNLRKY